MRATFILVVLCSAFAAQSGWAGEVRSSMQVSVTVLAHASVETLDSAGGITVTEADLSRGYLDVSRTYRLRSNTPRGALLQLHPRLGLARQIDVTGFPSPLQIRDTSVELMQPATERMRLSFRLWLQPEAVAGDYPLPVHLAALAIGAR